MSLAVPPSAGLSLALSLLKFMHEKVQDGNQWRGSQ